MKEIATTTWYLEMKKESYASQLNLTSVELPHGFNIRKWSPSINEYKSIYRAIGSNYNWVDRIIMAEEKLQEIITNSESDLFLLEFDGQPAGYAELHLDVNKREIVYFGLYNEYTGRKIGLPFLQKVIEKAFENGVEYVWLHTCDLDHPAALPLYQKAGFVVYKTEIIMQPVI